MKEVTISGTKKIQVIPNADSRKTKWSRAIRYGDLIFTTAHSAARPDGTMPTTPEEQIRGCFESLKNTLEGGDYGMDMVLHCDCFLAHREDFALMNQIFDEYFLGGNFPHHPQRHGSDLHRPQIPL
ncbi:MAG: RidA family protein [Dysosmobacter sp.]